MATGDFVATIPQWENRSAATPSGKFGNTSYNVIAQKIAEYFSLENNIALDCWSGLWLCIYFITSCRFQSIKQFVTGKIN